MTIKPDAQLVSEPEVRTSAQSGLQEQFERWFQDTFHGVPGLTTEMFNDFRRAADEFKARLSAKEQ